MAPTTAPVRNSRDPIEDPGLPDVIATRPRHRRDEPRIGDRHEGHSDRRQDDRQDRRTPSGT